MMKRVAVIQRNDSPDETWNALARDLSDKIGAPECIMDSVIQYRLRHRESMKRFHQRETVAALLFVYSKNYLRNGMSLKVLCETVGADRIRTGRYLTRIVLDGGLTVRYKSPEEYVQVYGPRLNVGKEVVERSIKLIRRYREFSPLSANPRTIGASALYLACRENGHRHTQHEIADTFGIVEYTLRENCGRMRNCLEAIESQR